MKRRLYVLLCCIIVCALFLWASVLLGRESFDDVPLIESEKEEYILHRKELVPREEIESIVVAGGRIYILYDRTALINVYRTDGTFEYGIQLPTFQKGRGDIAVMRGDLYVRSRRGDIYVFRDDKLLECIDSSRSYDRYIVARSVFDGENIPFDGMHYYQISEESKDIIIEGTNTIVVDLPEKSHRAEQLLNAGLLILALSLFGYEKLFQKTD